jgi:hypothetical protein
MRSATDLARELLALLEQEPSAETAVFHVRNACQKELEAFPPALVEKRISEAMPILLRLGIPQSRLAALTLLAFVQVGLHQPWKEAQRKSLRLHDVLTWIAEQYGIRYAENTRESLRRDYIAPMVQMGILEHNPDAPGLPPNHPKNHYAISEVVLKIIWRMTI